MSDEKGKVVWEKRKEDSQEQVNHPQHYGGDTPYEVIKVLEAWELEDFCLCNTVKYIARAGKKEPGLLNDLRKAAWYLNRKIANLEKAQGAICIKVSKYFRGEEELDPCFLYPHPMDAQYPNGYYLYHGETIPAEQVRKE